MSDKYQALRDALKAGPTAYARKWHFDGVEPKKELNASGRWAWPAKFKFLRVTEGPCAKDDVALWAVDLPSLLADLDAAVGALELIASTDPIDAALDPQRAIRVSSATLSQIKAAGREQA